MLGMQPRDQIENALGGDRVEIARGFVCQKQLRAGDQRPSQRNSLLFASGKLARTMMCSVRESHFAQPLGGTGLSLLRVLAPR